jgi:hypothetical protein
MWVIRFWAFTPLMLQYNDLHPETTFNIPILSFIIGIGGLACILSGYLSQTFGAKRIAFIFLSCGAVLFSFSICFSVSDAVSCFLAFWEWSLLILHFYLH